jgi:hypothetical protein
MAYDIRSRVWVEGLKCAGWKGVWGWGRGILAPALGARQLRRDRTYRTFVRVAVSNGMLKRIKKKVKQR